MNGSQRANREVLPSALCLLLIPTLLAVPVLLAVMPALLAVVPVLLAVVVQVLRVLGVLGEGRSRSGVRQEQNTPQKVPP
jgi:hypothetical protein